MRSFAELAFTRHQVRHKTSKYFDSISRLRGKLVCHANTIIALRGFGIVWQQLGVDGSVKVTRTATIDTAGSIPNGRLC